MKRVIYLGMWCLEEKRLDTSQQIFTKVRFCISVGCHLSYIMTCLIVSGPLFDLDPQSTHRLANQRVESWVPHYQVADSTPEYAN